MPEGFITADNYAAIPYGKNKLIIIYEGAQIEEVKTKKQAIKVISDHRVSSSGIGTVFSFCA